MELIKQLWRGEIPLVRAYWLFGFVGGILLRMVPLVWALSEQTTPIVVYVLYSGIAVIYSFVVLIGVWRSATKYHDECRMQVSPHKKKKSFWAILAKIGIIMLCLNTVLGVILEASEFIQ